MATAIDTPQSPGSHLMPALDRATVADAMHPGILSCEPEMSLSAVARMMASHHVHCLVVLGVTGEEDGDSLVWRILSDLDLLHGAMLEGGGQTADALARQAVHTVDPTMPLRAAGDLMLKLGASHVLVVDPLRQRPLGVLSTLDIAGVLAWGVA